LQFGRFRSFLHSITPRFLWVGKNIRMKITFFSYFDRVMLHKLIRTAFLTLLILVYSVLKPEVQGFQQQAIYTDPLDPPFLAEGARWADSLMADMNLEERIAQMIMVYGYSIYTALFVYGIQPA